MLTEGLSGWWRALDTRAPAVDPMRPPGHGWWGHLDTNTTLAEERDRLRRDTARLLDVPPGEIVIVEHERRTGIDMTAAWYPPPV